MRLILWFFKLLNTKYAKERIDVNWAFFAGTNYLNQFFNIIYKFLSFNENQNLTT